MTRRPTWLAWVIGTAGATVVLVLADRLSHDAAEAGGWRLNIAAAALYAGVLVGLGMLLLGRARTWPAAALLSAVIVWIVGWLAPALAVGEAGEGTTLVMLGTGFIELPLAALLGLRVFLRCAGWQHPRSDSAGREARRTA